MPKRINSKILLAELKEKIRNFYPYLLGFYLLSLVVANFWKDWSRFFNWPAFHGVIIFFTLILISTFKFKIHLKNYFKIKDFKLRRHFIITITKNSAHRFYKELRKYFSLIYAKLASLSRRTWLKIFIIAIVLILAIFKEIAIFDFLVLVYALISVLFILDSRYAAGTALVFLAACPFLLILKKDLWAESSAIYAYYFLVITVITQIRELKKEDKKSSIFKN